jgi:hypothetical protein
VVDGHQVTLTRRDVQNGARDRRRLALGVGQGDVHIDVALPHLHRHRNVLEPETPVAREESEILRRRTARSRGGVGKHAQE